MSDSGMVFDEAADDFAIIDVDLLAADWALETLEHAAHRLADVDPNTLNRDAMNDHVRRSAKIRRMLEAAEAALLSDWDESRAFRADSAPSAKKWLEYQAGYGPKEAAVRFAH